MSCAGLGLGSRPGDSFPRHCARARLSSSLFWGLNTVWGGDWDVEYDFTLYQVNFGIHA